MMYISKRQYEGRFAWSLLFAYVVEASDGLFFAYNIRISSYFILILINKLIQKNVIKAIIQLML
jgi:hypothetical protein